MISVLLCFCGLRFKTPSEAEFPKGFQHRSKMFAFDRSEVRKRNILELVFISRNAKVVLYFTSKQLIYDSLTSDITVVVF